MSLFSPLFYFNFYFYSFLTFQGPIPFSENLEAVLSNRKQFLRSCFYLFVYCFRTSDLVLGSDVHLILLTIKKKLKTSFSKKKEQMGRKGPLIKVLTVNMNLILLFLVLLRGYSSFSNWSRKINNQNTATYRILEQDFRWFFKKRNWNYFIFFGLHSLANYIFISNCDLFDNPLLGKSFFQKCVKLRNIVVSRIWEHL